MRLRDKEKRLNIFQVDNETKTDSFNIKTTEHPYAYTGDTVKGLENVRKKHQDKYVRVKSHRPVQGLFLDSSGRSR